MSKSIENLQENEMKQRQVSQTKLGKLSEDVRKLNDELRQAQLALKDEVRDKHEYLTRQLEEALLQTSSCFEANETLQAYIDRQTK